MGSKKSKKDIREMASKEKFPSESNCDKEIEPFSSAEEAWFWFIQAQEAKNDGARFVAGQGDKQRPCEPLDILKVLDRLYRQRRLLRDHLLVLRHYGRRLMAPDSRRVKEARASELWQEALARIKPVLERKGIVAPSSRTAQPEWYEDAIFFEGMAAE